MYNKICNLSYKVTLISYLFITTFSTMTAHAQTNVCGGICNGPVDMAGFHGSIKMDVYYVPSSFSGLLSKFIGEWGYDEFGFIRYLVGGYNRNPILPGYPSGNFFILPWFANPNPALQPDANWGREWAQSAAYLWRDRVLTETRFIGFPNYDPSYGYLTPRFLYYYSNNGTYKSMAYTINGDPVEIVSEDPNIGAYYAVAISE